MRPFISLKPLAQRTHGQGLYVENVSLSDILKQGQTPLYVTSLSAVAERIQKYKNTLQSHFKNSNIFYACKANFSQPILKEVLLAGGGIDIVSIGEWKAALCAGYEPKNICFAGVGKKEEEWKHTILNGLGYLNCEHLQELEDILNFILTKKTELKTTPIISLRLNPCLAIETHPHLKTGALDSKFGILFSQFKDWLLSKQQEYSTEQFLQWIEPLKGIHVHIGSQLMEKEIFVHTVKSVFDCAQFLFEQQVFINHLDLGGGLGVPLQGVPQNGEDIAKHVNFLCESIKNKSAFYPQLSLLWKKDFSNLFVCLEPGRSVVASSTIFLTTVLYTKINAQDEQRYQFCYVDGAMNDFPRPSLYGAEHYAELVNFAQLTQISAQNLELSNWRVVGPVCESGDFLSKNSSLPNMVKNDVIAFFEAGAYCRSMASQYNLRELPSELFVKGDKIM
ncbi:MAG: diaminopimelate decarboxylase [Bdellovibrionota bacterium]